jgi:hypothetical protein
MLGSFSQTMKMPRRRMMAWLGLLALLFHSLLPLAHHSLQQRDTVRAGFDSIVICTAYGMRTILLGADGQPVSDEQAPANDKAARYCPICLGAQQAGTAILPASILLALPVLLAAVVYDHWSDAPLRPATYHQAQARAPPAAF